MKTIKSVLIGALVALLGSSAWAEGANEPSVTLEKSIASTDKNNATIRIVSNVKFSDVIHTNKILLVGSLCDSHGLLAKTVRGTVNELVKKGSVDWHFFARRNAAGATGTVYDGIRNFQPMYVPLEAGNQTPNKDQDPADSTSWVYRDEPDGYVWDRTTNRGYLPQSRHKVLKEMLTAVDGAISGVITTEPAEGDPDYIVFEFDGSRIMENYAANNTYLEDSVAQKLKWYYDNKRVIWIVDNESADNEPYTGKGVYYTPSTAYIGSDGEHVGTLRQFDALVALLDPNTYLTKDPENRYIPSMDKTWNNQTVHAANRNNLQTNYSDLDAIKALIEDVMKEPIYTAKAADTVASFGGALWIEDDSEISVYKWTGKSAPEAPSADKYIADATGNWLLISAPTAEVSRADNAVNVALTNLVNDSWYKVEIKVKADDDLVKRALDSDDKDLCKLSEDGKSYKINPNKGDAKFTLYRDAQDGQGPQECVVKSKGASNTWDFDRTQGKGGVLSVTKAYDGVATNIVATSLNPALANGDKIEYSWDAAHENWDEDNPTFTDVTPGETSVWYRVSYADPLYINFTNTFGYVSITQRVITITAENKTKTYGEKDPDFTCTTNGTIYGTDKLVGNLTRTNTSNNVGAYDITEGTAYNAGSNYTVTFNKGTLTITPAQIKGFHFGDKSGYDAATTPAVLAENVECFIDELPAGGTNITVKQYKSFNGDTFAFAPDAAISEIGVYTNKCTVSGEPNYLSTNVYAEIIIKEREAEVADKDNVLASDQVNDQIAATLKEIAKKHSGDTEGGHTIYAEARFVVSKETDSTVSNAMVSAFKDDYTNFDTYKCQVYDAALEYRENKSLDVWDNIGASNDKLITFVLNCPHMIGAQNYDVYRRHNGQIERGSDWAKNGEGFSVDTTTGKVKIWAKSYSEYMPISFTLQEPDCEHYATYRFVANLQTTMGAPARGYEYYTSDFANLGKNQNNEFWYNSTRLLGTGRRDAIVTVNRDGSYSWVNSQARNYRDLEWGMHSPDGIHSIPTLTIASADGTLNETETALLNNLKSEYNRMSAGAWCCQLVWQIHNVVESGCYRVAAYNYIDAEVVLCDNCCADAAAAFRLPGSTVQVIGWELGGLFNRFGSIESEKATQLEIYASVGGLSTVYGELPFTGVLAGQGYWQEIEGRRLPVQISGQIVGSTISSICEYCCWDPEPAVAFDCLENDTQQALPTAAFGDFYLNYVDYR